MKKYFKNENGIIKFNVGEFLEKQRLIWSKYDNSHDLLLYLTSEKEFISNYDRYLLMTLEEITEAKEEFDLCNDRTNKEYTLEIIDILMYNMTMVDIVKMNIKSYFGVLNRNEDSKLINSIKVENCNKKYSISEEFFEIQNILISTRRLYSARKWHKPHLLLDNEENLKNLFETYDLLLLSVSHLCKLLCSNNDVDTLNKLINEKQDFVINLPMYHQ